MQWSSETVGWPWIVVNNQKLDVANVLIQRNAFLLVTKINGHTDPLPPPETSSRVAYVMAQYEVHSALTAVSVLIGAMFDGLAADNTDKPNRLHPSYLMLSKYDI